MAETDLEPHPLFLPEGDDDDIVQVSQIHITRLENGQQVYAPRVREASELRSLDQVSAEFGGGCYILIARHENRISTKRKYVLPGKPKSMFDETEKETTSPTVSQTPTIDPMSAAMGSGPQGGLMGLIMMMMQQMMQQQAQAAASQTQMFIAMMQSNQQSSAEEKAQARAELQANIERERISSERTMALMREMMTSKGGGSGEDFTRGVEFMRSFATQQIETLRSQTKGDGDTDWGNILETLGQVMQGVGMFKQVAGTPLPEGAASVAESVAEAAQ
jgi:hypothetical protein